jgi:hypothetical protein
MSHELWRPEEISYDSFVTHLERAGELPTYLPWPLRPGWSVVDFGVASNGRGPGATLTAVSGPSEVDGPVDLLVIAEEAGVGLGAQFAGTPGPDPGIGDRLHEIAPAARIRIGSQPVPLWPVSLGAVPAELDGGAGQEAGEWDRSVVAGEAGGRWLWVLIRPAAAVLLLQESWELRDVSGLGMALVELPFGGSHPRW